MDSHKNSQVQVVMMKENDEKEENETEPDNEAEEETEEETEMYNEKGHEHLMQTTEN